MDADEAANELRVLTSSRDLDDYDILMTNLLSVAVPHSTTEGFRKLIWAAMVTYGLGNSSVDNVIRRYDHMWDRRKDKSFQTDPRILALRTTAKLIHQIAESLEQTKIEPRLGHICAKAALIRLEASFKAAYGLIRKEYIFETDAVVRLILEQLAWAYSVHSAADEKVLTLEAPDCIGRFKAIYPACGRLYGVLSEWAHIDPSIAENYLEFHREGIDVVRRSAFNSFESGIHLMQLSLVYLEIVQQLFSPLAANQLEELREQLETAKARYDAVKSRSQDAPLA